MEFKMKFDINYYFEEIDKNEIFDKFAKGKENVMEIFDIASKFIKEIEESGKQEIHTAKNRWKCENYRKCIYREGTEIQNGCIIQGPAYIGKTVNLCIIHT